MDKTDQILKNYLQERKKALAPGEETAAPEAWVQEAKDLFPKKDRPARWQRVMIWGWFGVALLCFGMTFVFPQYFIQFIALSVIFAVKWIVDQKAMKTQILIYKALREEGCEDGRDGGIRTHDLALPKRAR